MAVLQSRELPDNSVLQADICICGAGPAGLALAHVLRSSGLVVLIVESGTEKPNAVTQQLTELESVGFALRPNFINRLRMAGGTSNLWSGRCVALDSIDFEERAWVPHSGWPISYAEYADYLEEAGRLLHLPSDKGTRVTDVGEIGGKDADLAKKNAFWARKPARFWALHKRELARAAQQRVVLDLTVTQLKMDAAGKTVLSLVAAGKDGRHFEVRARQFILAMGGLENVRTLLLACRKNPQAHVPRDPLGRYFMDHPRAVHGKIRLADGVDWRALVGRHPVRDGIQQALFRLDPGCQRRDRLLNAYVNLEPAYSASTEKTYSTTIEVLKRVLRKGYVGSRLDLSEMDGMRDLIYQLTPEEILPYPVYRALHATRRILKQPPRNIVLVNHCEQVPDPASRITLDERKDRFGNPLLRLDWRVNALETETLARLHRAIGSFIEKRKLGQMLTVPDSVAEADFTDASHHIGGTRMSEDARSGVVDRNLRVHGVDNLYICGSSVFPTGGAANPTWSIVAFAVRLGRHLLSLRS